MFSSRVYSRSLWEIPSTDGTNSMTVGTIFTLFILPAVYVLLARDHTKDREREAALKAAAAS